MAFDFSKIVEKETEKVQAAEAQQKGGGLGFKTVYPFGNGRLEFHLLANEPSNMIYRELVFHEYWADGKKQKVACPKHMYNDNCKICDLVDKVQEKLEDKDVFGKYGFKKQGIMFAKLLNFAPENYFGDTKNPPKIGEIVKFMFPKSVIAELGKIIVEYGDEAADIFASNNARRVALKIGTQANGFPEYSFMVKGNTDVCFEDEAGNPDDAKFTEFMSTMPNLKEVNLGTGMTENDYKVHTLLVEEIQRKYFGEIEESSPSISEAIVSSVSNKSEEIKTETTNVSNNDTSKNDEKTSRPDCFNNNRYDDECNKCPFTNECV